jgi:sec-independent protein translocase protein TatA
MQLLSSLTTASSSTLAWGLPHNGMEWIIIGVIALLLFGKRLPGVARSLGTGIVEFKKGLKGGGEQAEAEAAAEADEPKKLTDQTTVRTARFDPQTGKPLTEEVSSAA